MPDDLTDIEKEMERRLSYEYQRAVHNAEDRSPAADVIIVAGCGVFDREPPQPTEPVGHSVLCRTCEEEGPRDGTHLLRLIPRYPSATFGIITLLMGTTFGAFMLGASHLVDKVSPVLVIVGQVVAILGTFALGLNARRTLPSIKYRSLPDQSPPSKDECTCDGMPSRTHRCPKHGVILRA